VVIAFPGALKGDTTLLQQVVLDDTSLDHPLVVETHLHKLAKARTVVIPYSFRVACFNENKISLVKLSHRSNLNIEKNSKTKFIITNSKTLSILSD